MLQCLESKNPERIQLENDFETVGHTPAEFKIKPAELKIISSKML